MISTLLIEYPLLFTVLAVLVLLVVLAVGFLLERGDDRRRRRLAPWPAGLGVLGIALLTLSPNGPPFPPGCTVDFHLLSWWSITHFGPDMANVALFVPAALFATVATHRPGRVLAAGAVLSAAIETLQALVGGIGRICDTSDWTFNVTGTVIGVLVAVALRYAATRRGGRPADRDPAATTGS